MKDSDYSEKQPRRRRAVIDDGEKKKEKVKSSVEKKKQNEIEINNTKKNKKIEKTNEDKKTYKTDKSVDKKVSKKTEKEYEKKKPKKKNSHKFIKFMLFLFFIIILSVGIYLLLTLDYFKLETLDIDGTNRYTVSDISQVANINVGGNIFVQLFKWRKHDFSSLPYIETVNLGIELPNKLTYKVIERESIYFAYDKEKDVFFRLDNNGNILEQCESSSKKPSEVYMYGITFDNEVELGKKINEVDLSKIAIYVKIYNEFVNSNIDGNITKVNFENSLTTITINDKLNCIFPNDTDLEYKMGFLEGILNKLSQDTTGTIDMTKTRPVLSGY